jgi:hypothetical protein
LFAIVPGVLLLAYAAWLPSNVGHRNQRVRLFDGAKQLLLVKRTITVIKNQ